MLTADRDVSERLVRHPGVDRVTFTGSTAAGKRIASLCGERVARCTLEPGGKSAAIILDDYDIAKAAATLAQSARMLTGQVCMALTRIIVTERRHDALLDALSASFGSTRAGDPFDATSQMGGFKQSGIGREGGTEGLLPFLEAKTLLLEQWPQHLQGAARP